MNIVRRVGISLVAALALGFALMGPAQADTSWTGNSAPPVIKR